MLRTLQIAFALLLIWGAAWSQEPPPAPGEIGQPEQRQADENQPKAAPQTRGTENAPFVIKILPADHNESAGKTAKEPPEIPSPYGPIEIFTGLLVFVGFLQFMAMVSQFAQMRRANEHFAIVERAYVKISHPPVGVEFIPEPEVCWVSLRVEIRNNGRTPANVTDVTMTPIILSNAERLPAEPAYRRIDPNPPAMAFLVTQDHFFYTSSFRMCAADKTAIDEGAKNLYWIGFVDYLDKFGQRHHGRYARVFNPQLNRRDQYRSDVEFETRTNLVFVPQPGYNDDILIGRRRSWWQFWKPKTQK